MKRTFYILFLIFALLTVRGQKKEDNLFVFVGEKISVTEFTPVIPEGSYVMDQFFKAKYVVLQKVFGEYSKDTIEFQVADHYGFPPFAKTNNALLYVVKEDGKWYHQKYMYSPLYKTVDNKWAGMYQGRDYEHINNKDTQIKPEKIQFKDKPFIEITETSDYTFGASYHPAYYKIIGGKAYPTHGNYVEELFMLKKNGFLKYHGYFK